MVAVITKYHNVWYNLGKEYSELFIDSRWVYSPSVVFGRNFDSYILAHGWEEIKDLDTIIAHLESHGTKRKYL